MTAMGDREGTGGRNLGDCRSAEPIRAGSRVRVRDEEVPSPTPLPPRANGVCLGLVLHVAVTADGIGPDVWTEACPCGGIAGAHPWEVPPARRARARASAVDPRAPLVPGGVSCLPSLTDTEQ
jgi:hypothetical protein